MTPNKQVSDERRILKTMKQVEKPTKWMIRPPPPPMPTRTTTMVKHLNKPVGELRSGADDNVSTLATQENPGKNLVYIMNMSEGILETTKNVRDPSKNTTKEDDKKRSPVEKTDQVTSNDQLNAYKESETDKDSKKAKAVKKNTWRMRKIIHMEFESDDDVDEQAKNSNNVKAEGTVRVKKKIVHYYEISSDEEEGKHADLKKLRKPKKATKIKRKMMKMIRLLCQMK